MYTAREERKEVLPRAIPFEHMQKLEFSSRSGLPNLLIWPGVS